MGAKNFIGDRIHENKKFAIETRQIFYDKLLYHNVIIIILGARKV